MEDKTTILIVDDDAGMTETMSDIMEEMGYDVDVAGNGHRAIEMMKDRAYDLALMDIKMPGINGVETFKAVKHISPSTRVIMMTAYSVEDLVKEALDEGAYAMIYKPLDIEKVAKLLWEAGKGILVMVVDDDPNICESLKDIFEERGFKVAVAGSGKQAISIARKDNVEVVFIDVKMPVLNGLETYLAIKEINPDVTAIMITGYREEGMELVEAALSKSAYTCLYKPLDMDKVVVLLDELCRKKR